MSTFRKYIRRVPDPVDASRDVLDAAEIVSKACYDEWMSAREYDCADHAGKTFQRALTGHISASDGRLPFSPEEEAAILKVIRAKRIWPCFEGSNPPLSIGAKGFRSKGFHERQGGSDGGGAKPESLVKKRACAADSDDGPCTPARRQRVDARPAPPAFSFSPPSWLSLPPFVPSFGTLPSTTMGGSNNFLSLFPSYLGVSDGLAGMSVAFSSGGIGIRSHDSWQLQHPVAHAPVDVPWLSQPAARPVDSPVLAGADQAAVLVNARPDAALIERVLAEAARMDAATTADAPAVLRARVD